MKTQRALPLNFSGYPLRVADEITSPKKIDLQVIHHHTAQQPVTKLSVHPFVGDPQQWDECWFANYE